MSCFSIKGIGKTSVIICFMFVGIAHAIPEKYGVQTLCQHRKDQTPDSVIDKVLIDLRAGGETASELCGERHECDTHRQGHLIFVNQQ